MALSELKTNAMQKFKDFSIGTAAVTSESVESLLFDVFLTAENGISCDEAEDQVTCGNETEVDADVGVAASDDLDELTDGDDASESDSLSSQGGRTVTENSSPTYSTSYDPRVDFFFHVMEKTDDARTLALLEASWSKDALVTLKLVAHIHDRQAKGIRHQSHVCLWWLYQHHPRTLYENMEKFVRFGYWKDLLHLVMNICFDGFIPPYYKYDDCPDERRPRLAVPPVLMKGRRSQRKRQWFKDHPEKPVQADVSTGRRPKSHNNRGRRRGIKRMYDEAKRAADAEEAAAVETTVGVSAAADEGSELDAKPLYSQVVSGESTSPGRSPVTSSAADPPASSDGTVDACGTIGAISNEPMKKRKHDSRKVQMQRVRSNGDTGSYNRIIAEHYGVKAENLVRRDLEQLRLKYARERYNDDPKYRLFHVKVAKLFAGRLFVDRLVMQMRDAEKRVKNAEKKIKEREWPKGETKDQEKKEESKQESKGNLEDGVEDKVETGLADKMDDEPKAKEWKKKRDDLKKGRERDDDERDVSLAGKWAPTVNQHFDRYTLIASSIAMELAKLVEDKEIASKPIAIATYLARKLYHKDYCVPLRKYHKVPERFMCSNAWNDIDYRRVPARCMKKNTKLFLLHDQERFEKFVKKDKTKVAGATLKPVEIVQQALELGDTQEIERTVCQKSWDSLVDSIRKKGGGLLKNAIALCDVSGSMAGTPMMAAMALTLLTMEMTGEPWNTVCITFTSEASLHSLEPSMNLREKLLSLQSMPWGGSTNFNAIFEVILSFAGKYNLQQDQMPKVLFVFSDMEFDEAVRGATKTNYEAARDMMEKAGYRLPSIVFWNLRPSVSTPVRMDENGTILLSGYSGQQLAQLAKTKNFDDMTGLSYMLKAINENRYNNLAIYD